MSSDRTLQLRSTFKLGVNQLASISAIVFPSLHTLTDVMEWIQSGFSQIQLWLNYVAFLPMPAILLGLVALQYPAVSLMGLWGALLYGFSFVYFAHSTLDALEMNAASYSELWHNLGALYTVHGVVMVLGGVMFGIATLQARVFPIWTAHVFLIGIAMNLGVALLPVPEIWQTIGSTARNAGLVGMGYSGIVRGFVRMPNRDVIDQ